MYFVLNPFVEIAIGQHIHFKFHKKKCMLITFFKATIIESIPSYGALILG